MIKKEILVLILVAFMSGALGWISAKSVKSSAVAKSSSKPLRKEGFTYIKPLLLADYSDNSTSSNLADLEKKINSTIISAGKQADLNKISVFYKDLKTGDQVVVNGDEKYFPASLSKVPAMMGYYKLSESDPELLSKKGFINYESDYNEGQLIKPANFPKSGEQYSVQELIDMMIINSDNIGFFMLMNRANAEIALKQMFDDLHVLYPYNQEQIKEVFSVREFARFFRLLYNATYLNPQKSEDALELLSRTDYKAGIVSGVQSDVKVAHKYGLDQSNVNGRTQIQLHDCGIIYAPGNPYLLCVMTKSSGELKNIESLIAKVSEVAYKYNVK